MKVVNRIINNLIESSRKARFEQDYEVMKNSSSSRNPRITNLIFPMLGQEEAGAASSPSFEAESVFEHRFFVRLSKFFRSFWYVEVYSDKYSCWLKYPVRRNSLGHNTVGTLPFEEAYKVAQNLQKVRPEGKFRIRRMLSEKIIPAIISAE